MDSESPKNQKDKSDTITESYQWNDSSPTGRPNQIVILNTDFSISDSLYILNGENNILSAPLMERIINSPPSSSSTSPSSSSSSKHNNEEELNLESMSIDFDREKAPRSNGYVYRGFVDVLDILSLILYIIHRQGLSISSTNSLNFPIFQQSLKQTISFSSYTDFSPIYEHFSLLQAVEELLLPRSPFKSHRLPVFNSNDELVGIISQTDILYLARENISQFASFAQKTAKELKIVQPTINIDDKTTARDALNLLHANRVNGIAITDSQSGKLIYSFSPSDLRSITIDKLDYFEDSVLTYLKRAHQCELEKPVIINEQSTLKDIINIMCDHSINRVYMVDENGRPQTVTTVSDVLSALLNC
eukprot:gene2001-2463_t